MPLEEDIVDDPITFTTNHPLYVTPFNETHLKNNNTYRSVESAHRIQYFQIEENDPLFPTARLVNLQNNYQNNWYPCFWLPFQNNQICKCTLVDKRTNQDKQTQGEANAFFTPLLDGCSIFIEGTRAAPSVYHANQIGLSNGHTPQENIKRIAAMDQMWAAADTSKRLHQAIQNDNVAGFYSARVNAGNYLSHFVKTFDQEAHWANRLNVQKSDIANVDTRGVVFGVRNLGNWTFYCQRFTKVQTNMGNRQMFANAASEIWPNGPQAISLPTPKTSPHRVRPEWVPDSYSNNCMRCSAVFGTFTRRHHCRQCGLIFCNSCTTGRKTVRLPAGSTQAVEVNARVCTTCLQLVH